MKMNPYLQIIIGALLWVLSFFVLWLGGKWAFLSVVIFVVGIYVAAYAFPKTE
jgi:hypothetical protein